VANALQQLIAAFVTGGAYLTSAVNQRILAHRAGFFTHTLCVQPSAYITSRRYYGYTLRVSAIRLTAWIRNSTGLRQAPQVPATADVAARRTHSAFLLSRCTPPVGTTDSAAGHSNRTSLLNLTPRSGTPNCSAWYRLGAKRRRQAPHISTSPARIINRTLRLNYVTPRVPAHREVAARRPRSTQRSHVTPRVPAHREVEAGRPRTAHRRIPDTFGGGTLRIPRRSARISGCAVNTRTVKQLTSAVGAGRAHVTDTIDQRMLTLRAGFLADTVRLWARTDVTSRHDCDTLRVSTLGAAARIIGRTHNLHVTLRVRTTGLSARVFLTAQRRF
jgi:hypothetical protein